MLGWGGGASYALEAGNHRWFVAIVGRTLGLGSWCGQEGAEVRFKGGGGVGVTGWEETYRRPPWPHLGHK